MIPPERRSASKGKKARRSLSSHRNTPPHRHRSGSSNHRLHVRHWLDRRSLGRRRLQPGNRLGQLPRSIWHEDRDASPQHQEQRQQPNHRDHRQVPNWCFCASFTGAGGVTANCMGQTPVPSHVRSVQSNSLLGRPEVSSHPQSTASRLRDQRC